MSTKFQDTNVLKCKHTGARFPFEYGKQYTTETVLQTTVDTNLLHSRFGHCSTRRLHKLVTRSTKFPTHTPFDLNHDPTDCDACQSGGMRRKAFPKREGNPYTYFGEHLSSDLCGPLPKSITGEQYMLNIIDGHTNHLFIYHLRDKSSNAVKLAFEKFLTENKKYLPTDKPVGWHTDNGGEFMSSDLEAFCEEFAVKRSFSVPYAPPQNAHAERMWGILLRPMRTMIAESQVHESFWPYAADHACMLHNMLPSTKLAGEISPFQAKYGTPPDVSKVRVWGCTCWYFLPEHERTSKISPRAVPAIHLGIDPSRNGYLVYVPHLNAITSAYHLTFQERKFLRFTDEGITNKPRNIKPLRTTESTYREPRDRDDPTPKPCDDPACTLPEHSPDTPHSYDQRPTRDLGRSPRFLDPKHRRPNYVERVLVLEDVNHQALVVRAEDLLTDIVTPNTYKEAIASRHAERWRDSMNKEITDLLKHSTWELVRRKDVPAAHNITKSRWVYKVKLNRDKSIERFKSRFVVCGYSQVKGVDYTHSFSATLRATSFRLLLALAAGEQLKLEHFDVTNAFTQSDIDSEIYVEPPPGFPNLQHGEGGEPMVLKLLKSLYGTKQASRMWQLKLRSKLIEMGFSNSPHDPCLFCKRDKVGNVLLLGVYVDDIILAHKGSKFQWFVDEFTGPKGFRAKHVGKLSWFLGVGIDQAKDYSVTIEQRQYIDKLLERFVPTRQASVIKHSMPCSPITFQKLSTAKSDSERDRMSRLPYLELIGSLLYLSTMTRPDIAYHMSILCSFMHDPSPDCYYAAIDLLLFVSHTQDQNLHFSGSVRPPSGLDSKLHSSISTHGGLIAYSDASWRNPDKLGFNSFGFVVYLYGAPVSFAAKRLKVVALSSAEAEYAAAAYACKELVFVRNVLGDLGFRISEPTVLAVDNQAAIKIAENLGVTGRNKHFTDAIHFFRHLVDHRVVTPTFVRTTAQHADGFTKPLGKGPFRAWQRILVRSS